ncbi:MAG: hypothetical protein K9H49_15610 [Bacteroidales bacterium]|nr:hypothetical protein [Bacteroidales bacterium]MCF8405494.1 hypothetical protein [Bacteroidales bacterium]
MKRTILILGLFVFTLSLNAQIIALHSASGVQIFNGNTALASAYTAAQDSDTLYLSGGTFFPPAYFDKQLTIFGAGHYVDSTLTTGKTFISGNVYLQENADLFYLEGLEITGNMTFNANHSINNAKIKRCKINGATNVTGDLSNATNNLELIANIFIGTVDISNTVNVGINNNIFQNLLKNTYGNQINNNIFLGGGYVSTWTVFTGNNNFLNNNIFLFGSGITYSSGNTFYNNLFIKLNPGYGTTPTIVNSYENVPQADIFISQSGTSFDYSHNYHLKSPLTYTGTDGSEIGIYGGVFPYKEGAVPMNPHIQLKNISPKTNESGELNVIIKVGTQNN